MEPIDLETAGFTISGAKSSRRIHGSLEAITDSERRALRSIGLTAREAAHRTGRLLDELFALPSVRIFQGVLPAGAGSPRIPYVINAGHRVLLVESVAWPPGQYRTSTAGRVYCDGAYIGQSIQPLVAMVRHWRTILPDCHLVSAVIVVHRTARGELALPAPRTQDLAWVTAENAVHNIWTDLPPGRAPVSLRAVATLIAATTMEATTMEENQ